MLMMMLMLMLMEDADADLMQTIWMMDAQITVVVSQTRKAMSSHKPSQTIMIVGCHSRLTMRFLLPTCGPIGGLYGQSSTTDLRAVSSGDKVDCHSLGITAHYFFPAGFSTG